MSFTCENLEAVLREDSPDGLEAARAHAAVCADCRQQLEDWDSISVAAKTMRRDWDSPGLWYRIQETISGEQKPKESFFAVWRLAFTVAALVLISIATVWLVRREEAQTTASKQFLTEQALQDVEASEAAYVKSIEKLQQLAEPVLEKSPSPLLASYREKLVLLDGAIAELRATAQQNTLNAQVRTELVSLYREKQQTLTEVLRHAKESSPPVSN